jgi:hypothetical protein
MVYESQKYLKILTCEVLDMTLETRYVMPKSDLKGHSRSLRIHSQPDPVTVASIVLTANCPSAPAFVCFVVKVDSVG